MLYEAIIFLEGEPFALGIKIPELEARVFEGSRLFLKVEEGKEVGVFFPTWKDLELLISAAFGRKGFKKTPLHFKWKIGSVKEEEVEDEIGRSMVKKISFVGEIPSEEFLSDKISRGDSLALEASILLSKWEKKRIRGELKVLAKKKAKKAISLGTRAEKILRDLFSHQKIYWAFTGALTYAKECYEISKEIERRAEVIRRATRAAKKVLREIGINVEEEEEPFHDASKALAGEYDLVVIAPCTLNTLAKISLGISDSPASCAASQAMKGGYPVLILPTDISGEYFLGESEEKKEGFHLAEIHSSFLKALGVKIARDPEDLKRKIEEELFRTLLRLTISLMPSTSHSSE